MTALYNCQVLATTSAPQYFAIPMERANSCLNCLSVSNMTLLHGSRPKYTSFFLPEVIQPGAVRNQLPLCVQQRIHIRDHCAAAFCYFCTDTKPCPPFTQPPRIDIDCSRHCGNTTVVCPGLHAPQIGNRSILCSWLDALAHDRTAGECRHRCQFDK